MCGDEGGVSRETFNPLVDASRGSGVRAAGRGDKKRRQWRRGPLVIDRIGGPAGERVGVEKVSRGRLVTTASNRVERRDTSKML